MLYLKEYRKRLNRITDFLPWAAIVAPGIILNKDGSLQRTFRFRGPDLASATQSELIIAAARINNILKRLSGNWAIFAESDRIESRNYPDSSFSYPIALMIDEERHLYFNSGTHFENVNYFTIVYLPPKDSMNRIGEWLIEKEKRNKETNTATAHLKNFLVETERIYDLFASVMVQMEKMDDEEVLTYLHSCISTKKHRVKAPEIPMYLDAILADSPLTGGFEPKLGEHYLRTVSVLGFPGTSIPGILDNLNALNFEYRWVTRFLPLDKPDAIKEINRYKSRWFAKRKTMFTLLKEALQKTESVRVDPDALHKSDDANQALEEIGSDDVSYGFFTATVTIDDPDPAAADKKIRAVETVINNLGFTVINESLNAVDAWLGSLPGLCRANVRRPLFNSLNLAHVFPLSAIWAGPEENHHLNGPPLMYTQTPNNTPFRLDLHVGDVGHTIILGPTGAGKSVLLAELAVQFLRYPRAQIYAFDKDRSISTLTAGLGGDFYDLLDDSENTLAFQPLRHIDDENERIWASEWIHDLLRGEKINITPTVKKTVWVALCSLASSPMEQRTLSGLSMLLQDHELRLALEPYTIAGTFGRLFDATYDNLDYGRFQVFEMGQLMNVPVAVAPALNYLFHKIEKRFQGDPTLLQLDESWLYLDHPSFAPKIREWLKTLRKKNVTVVFATQSLGDIHDSPIAPTIMDCCYTKIFLPNVYAVQDETAELYKSFGLNEAERELIATAIPKCQYYYKSILGSRLFELALGPIQMAYCATSSKDDQKKVREILSEAGKDNFNEAWLEYKNLPDIKNLYRQLICSN